MNLGPEGYRTFNQLATSISNAEIPLRKMNTLVEKFTTTLMNTLRWQISATLLNSFVSAF
jgi:hypothetical protein